MTATAATALIMGADYSAHRQMLLEKPKKVSRPPSVQPKPGGRLPGPLRAREKDRFKLAEEAREAEALKKEEDLKLQASRPHGGSL